MREEALGKWKDILRDEGHYEKVSAEEVYYWELEKMKVETLREIYRACTVSDTKADFNGVLKSVAQQVNKDDCMGRIVYYMVGVTKKDGMTIGGEEEEEEDAGGGDVEDEEKEDEEDMNFQQ